MGWGLLAPTGARSPSPSIPRSGNGPGPEGGPHCFFQTLGRWPLFRLFSGRAYLDRRSPDAEMVLDVDFNGRAITPPQAGQDTPENLLSPVRAEGGDEEAQTALQRRAFTRDRDFYSGRGPVLLSLRSALVVAVKGRALPAPLPPVDGGPVPPAVRPSRAGGRDGTLAWPVFVPTVLLLCPGVPWFSRKRGCRGVAVVLA